MSYRLPSLKKHEHMSDESINYIPSERTLLVERIADYLNEKEDLVALAFDQADGDILDTLTPNPMSSPLP